MGVVAGLLVVARRDSAPLLEPIDAALHDVASLVDLGLEGRRAPSPWPPEPSPGHLVIAFGIVWWIRRRRSSRPVEGWE